VVLQWRANWLRRVYIEDDVVPYRQRDRLGWRRRRQRLARLGVSSELSRPRPRPPITSSSFFTTFPRITGPVCTHFITRDGWRTRTSSPRSWPTVSRPGSPTKHSLRFTALTPCFQLRSSAWFKTLTVSVTDGVGSIASIVFRTTSDSFKAMTASDNGSKSVYPSPNQFVQSQWIAWRYDASLLCQCVAASLHGRLSYASKQGRNIEADTIPLQTSKSQFLLIPYSMMLWGGFAGEARSA